MHDIAANQTTLLPIAGQPPPTLGRREISLSRRRTIVLLVLIASDVVALCTAIALGSVVRTLLSPVWPITIAPVAYAPMLACLLPIPLIVYLVSPFLSNPVARLRYRFQVTAVVFGMLVLFDQIAIGGHWSRGIILTTFVFALFIPPLFFAFARSILERFGCWGAPTVILGAGDCGRHIVRILTKNPELGLRPVAIFDEDRAMQGTVIDGVPVVGAARELRHWVDRAPMCIISGPPTEAQLSELSAHAPFRHLVIVPDLAAAHYVGVRPSDFGGVVGLEINQNLLRKHNCVIKRTLDLAIALPLFVLTAPVVLVAIVAIVIASPGSPFFGHLRPGRHGKPFRMWKLRTMYLDADDRLREHLLDERVRLEWEQYCKLRNDPHPAGRRLVPPQDEPRRVAAAMERDCGDNEPRGAPPLSRLPHEFILAAVPEAADQRPAGTDRLMADSRPQPWRSS